MPATGADVEEASGVGAQRSVGLALRGPVEIPRVAMHVTQPHLALQDHAFLRGRMIVAGKAGAAFHAQQEGLEARAFEQRLEERWWPSLRRRYAEPDIAGQGQWTPDEQAAVNNYERIGHFLNILQSKARRSLKSSGGNGKGKAH